MKTLKPLQIGKRTLQLSNVQKVMYPATGFTKGQVIDYYVRIAPVLLPHLTNHPMTLKRYPNGVAQEFFYEKNCPQHHPDWVKTACVDRSKADGQVCYCLINDVATLAWVANLASLEIHPLLAQAPRLNTPKAMVFDLDPGSEVKLKDCAWLAFRVRELFAALKLKSFIKTSGSKGLHVYVPLNTAVTFDETKAFARSVAMTLEQEHSDRVVAKMAKVLRTKKVFIDWSQNDEHKTTVAPYSLRATETPSVSTPITWEELTSFLNSSSAESLRFTPEQVLARVKKGGDLFKDVLTLKQKLPRFK